MDSKHESNPNFASLQFTAAHLLEVMEQEDGPIFRQTIKDLEARTDSLKTFLKRLQKSIQLKLDHEASLGEADQKLNDLVLSTAVIAPAHPYILATWSRIADARRNFMDNVNSWVLVPLSDIYSNSVKLAEKRKKEFDAISSSYYAYLSKYLAQKDTSAKPGASHAPGVWSHGHSSHPSVMDTKHQLKKRQFDLDRFDYLAFLQDLHVNKEQDILSYYTLFLEKQAQYFKTCNDIIYLTQKDLSNLADAVHQNQVQLEVAVRERNERRKKIADSQTCTLAVYPDPADDGRRVSIADVAPPSYDSIDEDHHAPLLASRRKEGFLNCAKHSKDSKNIKWKRYWCILSHGLLKEYSGWKKTKVKNKNIIDLQLCTVRATHDIDRRFCFEIISPAFHRSYQATSSEEQAHWIACIQKSISSILDGTCSIMESNLTNIDDGFEQMSSETSSSTPQTTQLSLTPMTLQEKVNPLKPPKIHRATDSNDEKDATNVSLASAQSSIPPTEARTFLDDLYSIDDANRYCADCGMANPEWASINLGVLICIECSGIHRSLGTHISKVRSFLLDYPSFTPELKDLFRTVGNAGGREVWEQDLPDHEKPSYKDSRGIKEHFIRRKYIEYAYTLK